MRRIIVSMNVSIDGFIACPEGALDWQFNYWTADMARLLAEQLSAAGTILLGRNTYDAMAAYWPLAGGDLNLSRDDIAYAHLMNNYPKIVCSTTLKTAGWHNTRIIKNNVVQHINQLKMQAGKDIIVYGSAALVKYLAQNNLVDRYNLWVYPVVLGKGIALFNRRLPMRLSGSQKFTSGVIVLSYRV